MEGIARYIDCILYIRNGGNNEDRKVASYGIGATYVDLFYNILETLRDNN